MAAAGSRITSELAATHGLEQVASYWSLGNAPPLSSKGGHQALVLGVIRGSDKHVGDVIGGISKQFTRNDATVRVAVGGRAEVNRQVNDQIQSDLVRAEGIAFPITLVLLVIVFGSLVAAGLPLLVGVVAIAGSFLALFAISSVTEVSVYSLEPDDRDGSRPRDRLQPVHRLALPRGAARRASASRTPSSARCETAGRTVLGSALTVAVALGRLVLFPLSFLRSFAYAGIAVSAPRRGGRGGRAAGASRGARPPGRLPADLPPPRAEARRRRRLAPRRDDRDAAADPDRDRSHRAARPARDPVPAHPVRSPRRPRPARASCRAARCRTTSVRNFTSNEAGALQIAVPALKEPRDRGQGGDGSSVAAYATALSKLHGVARVDAVTGSYVHGTAASGRPRGHAALRERPRHLVERRAVGGAAVVGGRASSPTTCARSAFARSGPGS